MAHFLPRCHANIPDWHSIREIWTEARWSFIRTALFAQLVSSNMGVWVACCEMMGSLSDKGEQGVNCYSAERNHQTPSCCSSQTERQSSVELFSVSTEPGATSCIFVGHLQDRPAFSVVAFCYILSKLVIITFVCILLLIKHTVDSAGDNVKYWFAQNARKYCFKAYYADIKECCSEAWSVRM